MGGNAVISCRPCSGVPLINKDIMSVMAHRLL